MERHSLYIDHQLVSGLIRHLENIVRTCCEELDDEYEPYELRTSIYEEFVFQITTTFNTKYGLKHEDSGVKDEELKKFYELTTKLEGINSQAKLEDIQLQYSQKKGRPSKYLQAEEKLLEYIQNKNQNQGITKFYKKELDEIYLPLTNFSTKKIIPVNTYLRIFKKYDLRQITLIARGGKEKTLNDFVERKNSQSFWKKEEEDESTQRYENMEQSELQSTSQFQSDFQHYKEARMITRSSKVHQNQINFEKKELKSSSFKKEMKKDLKLRKQNSKKNVFNNFFDDNSDQQGDESDWNNNLSISNDFMEGTTQNQEIYENSKSFE